MMRPRIALTFALISAALLMGAVAAAPALETSFTQFTDVVPVIFAAILLSVTISGIYYMIGALIGSQKAKTTGLSEMYQAFGTAVLVVLLIAFMSFWNGLAVPSSLAPQSLIQGMCNAGYLSQSQLNFVNSAYSLNGQPGPTNIVCNDVVDLGSNPSLTKSLDYGLGAMYVIKANVTNQSIANLDAMYLFESIPGWLRSFQANLIFCVPVECAIPIEPDRIISVQYSYNIGAAYLYFRSITPYIEITATLAFYLGFLQLLGILMMLYMWPYMLAAGVLLHTFTFTRRMGGLLIAIVLGSVIIYPLVGLFMFNALSNVCLPNGTGPAGCINPIGASSTALGAPLKYMNLYEYPTQFGSGGGLTPPTTICPTLSSDNTCQYELNFYSEPNLAWVMNYNGCYPGANIGGILGTELTFALPYITPLEGIANLFTLFGGFASLIHSVPSSVTSQGFDAVPCFKPTNIAHNIIDVINAYGAITVAAMIIPLFEVLMVLSAIVGISGFLGGDTNIIGLGRFI
jgi:hypothetical protein